MRITGVLRSALNTHLARQNEDKLAAGGAWIDTGLVFTTTVGTPIDQRNLLGHYVTAVKNASLRKIRFHDLRHTAASLLLAQGVSCNHPGWRGRGYEKRNELPMFPLLTRVN